MNPPSRQLPVPASLVVLRSCLVLLTPVSSSHAESTINPSQKFAWGANVGWIDFRPGPPASPEGVVFGERFLWGKAYSANVGWIDFGDGSPADGVAYLNTSHTDFGVNHAGTDPNDASSFLEIVQLVYNDDYTAATVTFSSDPSRFYRLQTSEALGTGPDRWQDSGLGLFAGSSRLTRRTIHWSGNTRRFIRVLAVKPLL